MLARSLAALALVCAPALLGAQDASPPGVPPAPVDLTATPCDGCAGWNEPQRPFRIHGNSWYVGTRGPSAILVTSPEGHVLLDGALPESAPLVAASIRALGFRLEDVRLILNSHAHYDHAGGIAALQRASGAAVAAHFTGGHTPGGTTWRWRSCEEDRCWDIVYADSQTPISADGFLFTQSTAYPSGVADFERGQALLEQLPCDVLLAPHPGFSEVFERLAKREAGDPDAFRAPGACRAYAAWARTRLAERLAKERGGR